jgi:glycosyltransferase involved in cell wall biosynthesis
VHRLMYLSGAPRVSTSPTAESAGPRAHVLGVINAFRKLGWTVDSFVVGDLMPASWSAGGSESTLSASAVRRLGADGVRLLLRPAMREIALPRRGIGRPHLVYERMAAFQDLGRYYQRLGIPWVLETNAFLAEEAAASRRATLCASALRRLEIDAYRRCDVLVTVSGALKEILVAEAGIPARKVVVVPNGVDTDSYAPAASPPGPAGTPSGPLRLAFVGAMYRWQGLDRLLRALHLLNRSQVRFSLKLVGDGPEEARLRLLTSELGLQEAVHFQGRVAPEEVARHVAAAELCFSGQQEDEGRPMYNSPLKLYEYMALGRPVIASAFADAVETIGHRADGFLFAPNSLQSLVAGLEEARAARERLPAMGRAARDKAVAEFDWTKRVSGMLASIREVLA